MADEIPCEACGAERPPEQMNRRGSAYFCDVCANAPLTPWLVDEDDWSEKDNNRQLVHLVWFLVDRLAPKRED